MSYDSLRKRREPRLDCTTDAAIKDDELRVKDCGEVHDRCCDVIKQLFDDACANWVPSSRCCEDIGSVKIATSEGAFGRFCFEQRDCPCPNSWARGDLLEGDG